MDDYPLVEIEDMNADLIEGDSYLKDLTVADINGPGKHGTARGNTGRRAKSRCG